MKALEKAQAIYDLTMNTRCEEQVQYLFTKGIYKLMTDLIDELNEINFRNCDNCKTKNCSVKRILVEKEEISTDYFNCNDWESK